MDIDIWNHRVIMCIGNRVNASFNHANFENVLWAVEILILSNNKMGYYE